jgi:hypothetical protein
MENIIAFGGLERIREKQSWHISATIPGIHLEGQRKPRSFL